MNILLTGSSGRIGSAIAQYLVQEHQVCGVDQLPGSYTTHCVDLLVDDIRALCLHADVIIHCAALHAPHVQAMSDQAFWDVNVETTQKLLNLSRPQTKFVYTSTTSVYGDAMNVADETIWVDETLKPIPRDIYDTTKLAAEDVLRGACNNGRVGTSLRISRCFPEPEHLMALYRCYRGVDVRDVVQAHQQAMARVDGYACYVISGPTLLRQADLRLLGSSARRVISSRYPALHQYYQDIGNRLPQNIDRVYSSDLAMQQLGYRPVYGVNEFLCGARNPVAV